MTAAALACRLTEAARVQDGAQTVAPLDKACQSDAQEVCQAARICMQYMWVEGSRILLGYARQVGPGAQLRCC